MSLLFIFPHNFVFVISYPCDMANKSTVHFALSQLQLVNSSHVTDGLGGVHFPKVSLPYVLRTVQSSDRENRPIRIIYIRSFRSAKLKQGESSNQNHLFLIFRNAKLKQGESSNQKHIYQIFSQCKAQTGRIVQSESSITDLFAVQSSNR